MLQSDWTLTISVARSRERNKQVGLWKQTSDFCSVKKRYHYTLHSHINITLNPEMYCIVSLHLLLFLYVMILFGLAPGLQNNMTYNTIEEDRGRTSPKNPRLPIFMRLYRNISPKSLIIRRLGNCVNNCNAIHTAAQWVKNYLWVSGLWIIIPAKWLEFPSAIIWI